MNQGKALTTDVSPAHVTFSKARRFIDAPFLFRDIAHWEQGIGRGPLEAIADEIAQKADVMLIGYARRHAQHLRQQAVATCRDEEPQVRVQGAPIWSRPSPRSHVPTVIAYNEVYNASRTASSRRGKRSRRRRVDEVLRGRPNLSMTEHAITIRRSASGTFRNLPGPAGGDPPRGQGGGAYGRRSSPRRHGQVEALEKPAS